MAEAFIKVVNDNLNQICPVKVVKISQMDGTVNSLALKKQARQKKNSENSLKTDAHKNI